MNRDELLNQYANGKRDFSFQDLSRIKLRDKDLSGAIFVGANLSYSSFKSGNLSDTNFSNANLQNASLCDANLENANFSNADLRNIDISAERHGKNANFTNANFEGTDFDQGIIEDADFSGANFRNTRYLQFWFERCNFTKTDFSNSFFVESTLDNSNFYQANFSKSFLEVTFRNSSLVEANLEYAVLYLYINIVEQNINFERAKFNKTIYHNEQKQYILPPKVDFSQLVNVIDKKDIIKVVKENVNLDNIKYRDRLIEYLSEM